MLNTDCGRELYWRGCYKGTFNLITPESYGHPAKMAPKLCFKILEHLEELGLLKPGDVILDPLSGIGTTAIVACAKGYRAITVELEEKFIGFQKANKEYAGRRLHKELDWQIIQGDSRYLSKLLAERGCVGVTSPPWNLQSGGHGDDSKAKSPDWELIDRHAGGRKGGIGTTPGQIGNLKDAPLVGITSPPYGDDMKTGGGIDWAKANRPDRRIEVNPVTGKAYTRHNVYGINTGGYGHTEGQIGALLDKPFKVAMSPPYEDIRICTTERMGIEASGQRTSERKYGETEGNIGNTGESYLDAMKLVYAEIGKVADVLCVTVKCPTRNGKLRRLDLDTLELLRQTGWRIHCQHRALLFEEQEQGDLFKGSQKQVKGRLSFFKRLSYQKGQPVASWEDVILVVK